MDTESILPPPSSKDKGCIRFLGIFASPGIEQAFREQHFRDDLWWSRFLVLAGTLRVSLMLAADYFGMGPNLWLLFAGRLLFLLVSTCIFVALWRAASSAAVNRLFFSWSFLIAAMTVCALSARPPSQNGLLFMSFGIIVATYCIAPLTLSRQATLTLTYSAAILFFCRHVDGASLAIVGATHFMSHVFGTVTSWRLSHRRRETFLAALRETELRANLEAAAAEVRTLRGMLCMCAWCKRIRDEAEVWEPVDRYVQSRTHALFSHGICPECLQSQVGESA